MSGYLDGVCLYYFAFRKEQRDFLSPRVFCARDAARDGTLGRCARALRIQHLRAVPHFREREVAAGCVRESGARGDELARCGAHQHHTGRGAHHRRGLPSGFPS